MEEGRTNLRLHCSSGMDDPSRRIHYWFHGNAEGGKVIYSSTEGLSEEGYAVDNTGLGVFALVIHEVT